MCVCLSLSRTGQVDYAHYSLKAVGSATLEGTYHEDGEGGPTNEMIVRILFDDADGTMGQFQLAKKLAAPQGDEAPVPQEQPEPKTAFDFAFRKHNDGRFYMSESKWNGAAGGSVQFLATDDAFVFTKTACSGATPQTSAWTAVRHGAPRYRAAAGDGRRTMLQRWGWYIGAAMLYFGYKAAQEKVATIAAGAAPKKKK